MGRGVTRPIRQVAPPEVDDDDVDLAGLVNDVDAAERDARLRDADTNAGDANTGDTGEEPS